MTNLEARAVVADGALRRRDEARLQELERPTQATWCARSGRAGYLSITGGGSHYAGRDMVSTHRLGPLKPPRRVAGAAMERGLAARDTSDERPA